jgi:DNA polymerase IV (DinB-like DNA polymerase)
MKFETINDLKKLDVFTLNKEFGRKHGTYIFNSVRGIYTEPVKEREASIQFSKISTLKNDSNDYEFLAENLIELCKELHEVIKKNNRTFKSIVIQFIQSDLTSKTKSKMLKNHTASLEELEKNVLQLLKESLEDQKNTIRRLGVKVTELSEISGQSNITSYF